jgi:hypothetical protein
MGVFLPEYLRRKHWEPYNPDRSHVTTWLNYYLKRRLQDLYTETQKQQSKIVSGQNECLGSADLNQTVNPIENLAANPDVSTLLEEVRNWVETDPEGELRQAHITNRRT